MNRFEYIVVEIDGDYAHLKRTDVKMDEGQSMDEEQSVDEELKLVARALLPPETTEGTKLLYEWMSYSVME